MNERMNRTSLPYRRIPSNICTHFPLQEVENNSPYLEYGLCYGDSIPQNKLEKGKKSNYGEESWQTSP